MQRILILEHHQRTRATLEADVLALGVEVVTSATVADAHAQLAALRFDVLLLEPETPDAVSLLRELRARVSGIEVLLVTARSKPATLVELMRLGVADYVSKPVRQDELHDKLRKALERQKKKNQKASGTALAGRPTRDVLLAVPGDEERARIVALLGEVTSVTAEDGPSLARRIKLYVCHALVIDPALRGLDWPAFARGARQESLLVAVGDAGGEEVDGVLPRPVRDVDGLVAALRADADPLLMSGNVLRVQRGAGGVDRWFRRIRDELSIAIGGLGMARTGYAIIDLADAPRAGDRLGDLVAQSHEWATDAGMRLAIVGPPELKELVAGNAAARAVPFFLDAALAREAAKYFDDEA